MTSTTPKMMTANQIYVTLLNLRNEAGRKHYDRVVLASRLLQDKEWVESPTGGGGDENKAIDRLEYECFADICGIIGLPQLLDLYTHVPDIKDWEKAKYNLKKIWADWKSKQAPKVAKNINTIPRKIETASITIPTAAEFFNLSGLKQHQEYQKIARQTEKILDQTEELKAENNALKEENHRLKVENRALKNKLKGLMEVA